jgi:hypothetical protein
MASRDMDVMVTVILSKLSLTWRLTNLKVR